MKKQIKIGTPTGNNYGTELDWGTHKVKKVVKNPHNKYVPYEIHTCCGVYVPTSGADGYWQGSIHLGGWEWEDIKQRVLTLT